MLLVGYFGSIGIATLSDIVIPQIGTNLLSLDVPTHTQLHQNTEHADELEHQEHESKIHLGFNSK